jgi:hypothetical protein
METIHVKTVDPLSQDLLRGASKSGLALNWERYEKQQPQDGFLRLGLSCPYGCMQGPCRIDPFGRGADRGICGLDRDGMAAAFLLRLALQGALETMHSYQSDRHVTEIAWPATLDRKAAATPAIYVGAPLSTRETFDAALLLARPAAPPGILVRQAMRLCLLGISLMEQLRTNRFRGAMGCRIGYGLLAGEAILIGMAGQIPQAMVQSLLEETAGLNNPEARLITLGDWIPAAGDFLPIACTTGEAETVLSAGRLNLLLAGRQTDPGILALCGKMNVPVISSSESSGAAAILKRARESFDHRIPVSFDPDASLIGAARVSLGDKEVEAALQDGSGAKISLIGGADTLQQSLGYLPVELAKALRGEGHAVASWGDAAIWMVKQDLPVGILEAQEGPLTAVRTMAAAGKLPDVKGICFTGLRNCRELALALGLAALGLKVLVATPLPLWGSENVRGLLWENLAAAGGSLTHFDHPARAEEILDWFIR